MILMVLQANMCPFPEGDDATRPTQPPMKSCYKAPRIQNKRDYSASEEGGISSLETPFYAEITTKEI